MGSEGVLVGQSTVWSGIGNPAGREPVWPWWVVGGRGVHRFVARSSYKSGLPPTFCYQTAVVTSYHSGTIVTMWTHTRIRSDLRDRAKVQAARDGVSLSSFVERTLESALGELSPAPSPVSSRPPVRDGADLVRGGKVVGSVDVEFGENGYPKPESATPRPASGLRLEPAYRCPTGGCGFRAASAAAVCGKHGRKVIAA